MKSPMNQRSATERIVLRRPCGCVRHVLTHKLPEHQESAIARASLSRETLSLATVGELHGDPEHTRCDHQMRWVGRCGLKGADVAVFGDHVGLSEGQYDPTDRPALHKLGLMGGMPFVPAVPLSTLRGSLALGFTLGLGADGDQLSSACGKTFYVSSLWGGSTSVIVGAQGAQAVVAHAAITALGQAAMMRLKEGLRFDLLVPRSLPILIARQRSSSASNKHLVKPGMHSLLRTLYGALVAHHLAYDMRVPAAALWNAERLGGRGVRGFCTSLADVHGSAFSLLCEMELVLSPRSNSAAWLASRTNVERAVVVANGVDDLLRGML